MLKNKKIKQLKPLLLIVALVISVGVVAFGSSYASSLNQVELLKQKRVNQLKANLKADVIAAEIQNNSVDFADENETAEPEGGEIATAEAASCDMVKKTFSQNKYSVISDTGSVRFAQAAKAWGNSKYGTAKGCSKYKSSGCAPSSLASALSAYGQKVTPYDIGQLITSKMPAYRDSYTKGSPCQSGTKRSAIAAVTKFYSYDGYTLKAKKVKWSAAKKSVENYWQPVIVRTTNKCFTKQAHYLVIRGVVHRNKDGKTYYWINDSSGKNVVLASEAEIKKNASDFWVVGF